MKRFLAVQTTAQLRANPKCACPAHKDKPRFLCSGLGSRCIGLLLLLLAVLLLAQSALAQNDVICDPFDGDIDDDDNGLIEICYLEDLDAVRYQPDGTGYTTGTGAVKITAGCPNAGCNGYELSRDLDFLEDASYRDAEANKAAYTVDNFDNSADQGWDPLGTSFADAFRATFNGKRHTLSNLMINRPTESNVGLFALLRDPAKIENVGLINSEIRGDAIVGGLAGDSRGGFVGVQMTNNYVVGGRILAKSINVGGLVGEFSSSDLINASYANVRVEGGMSVGGLIGSLQGNGRNCYASGSVAGTDQVGGLIGSTIAQVQNNYAIAMLKANSGGFVGRVDSGSLLHNNYWDIERSGQSSSAGEGVGQLTGLSTVQMTSPTAPGTTVTEAYYNWSEEHWDFGSRYDYPALKYADDDLLGYQRPATKLSRLLLGIGERTLPLDVEQSVHQQSVDFDIEQISLRAEHNSEAILRINGTTATSGEMRSFDLAVAQTTTITLTLSLPYYVWPRIYALEVYRKANAELSELNVSAGQLMPPFNPQTTFYTLSVSATTETLIVTPVAADPEARVEVDGVEVDDDAPGREIALREGTTTISILVGSTQDTTTQSYTLAVRRPSRDARLQALSLSAGVLQPEFVAEQTTYTAEVFGAERIRLVPRAHRGATIEVNGERVVNGQPSAAIEVLRDTPTRISIMVTAEDGVTTQRYVVWVVRRIGTEARLATLSLPSIALIPPFEPDGEQRVYAATAISVREVVLTAIAALGGMLEVTVGSTKIDADNAGEYTIPLLQQATTTIMITVNSEDGMATAVYTIAMNHKLGDQAKLERLGLPNIALNPLFDADSAQRRYTATVIGLSEVILTATAALSGTLEIAVGGAKIMANNDSEYAIGLLRDGARPTTTHIVITVASEDETTQTNYYVAIQRQPSRDAQLTALSLADGTQVVQLTPSFSSTRTLYRATVVGTRTITLTATASRDATLSVNDAPTPSGQATAIDLSTSATTAVTLIVTAEDETTTMSYTVSVTHQPSSDAQLSALSLSDASGTQPVPLTPSFSSTRTTYTAAIAGEISAIILTATASRHATLTVNGVVTESGQSSPPITLSPGEPTAITLIVAAQDGTTGTYTLTATRAATAVLRIRSRLFLEAPLP